MSATYSVTASMVAAEGLGLSFSDSSPVTTPSATQVATQIARVALLWDGHIFSLGVDPAAVQAATTSKAFAISQQWVLVKVTAWALQSRVRGPDPLADKKESEAKAIWDMVEKRPASLADYQPTGDDSPNLTRYPTIGDTVTTSGNSSYWNNPTRRL